MELKNLKAPVRAAHVLTSTAAEVRDVVAEVVEGAANDLVAIFYSTFKDPEANRFLSHKLVSERLSLSLRQWLIDLYVGRSEPDIATFTERRKLIGDVHARMRIPIHLVMQAANLLKVGIFQRLRDSSLGRDDLWTAMVYTNRVMDLAI
jgi:diguanylate cyclase